MGPTRNALKDSGLKAENIDRVILVGGSTRIPAVQEAIKILIGKEPHKGVNPDEVVALGAAIQAGVLAGEVKDVLLLDVTPLSLGIETLGGVFTKIIERNTTIPTAKKQTFSTAADSQTQVDIHVLQGERSMAAGNKTLGRFNLDGIPPAPRGIPQIEVSFDIDANGIVNVSAKDNATGKEQKITITASAGLSDKEIDEMVKNAEQFAAEDEKRRELADARNESDSLCYSTEKMLRELGDKVDSTQKEEIEAVITKLKDVSSKEDIAAMRSEMETLTKHLHELSIKLYQQQEDEAKPAEEGGQSETVDAEYEVVDEDKK